MKILLTGAAGFIGFHVAQKLLARGDEVVGLDNLNDYYDPNLKRARLAIIERQPKFRFVKMDLADKGGMKALFAREKFPRIIHLAAQAGVRYSLENPQAYIDSNVTGTLNVLEGCRHNSVEHLVFASTSSVYGLNTNMPFSVHRGVDHPLSLYASTKRANELMAHNYAALFKLPVTGLRFFTVYGPWGRPDMAPILFSRAILAGRPIEVFNEGRMRRDFTYIDEIVAGVLAALDRVPVGPDSEPPHRVYNLGNHRPVELERFIGAIEQAAGRKAERILKPMQPGDMIETMADTGRAERDLGFSPSTTIEQGVPALVDWCRSYYGSQA